MAGPHAEWSRRVSYDDVLLAGRVLHGQVLNTPCARSRTLSDVTGCDLWLKFENLQFTASFKERGALNRLSQLAGSEAGKGVIAMSAGNHAQGVAYHAQRLGLSATIVMPIGTPTVKIVNTERYGANVIVEGKTLEDSSAFAREYGTSNDLTFIHPYDDPLVIAGQGSIALEFLEKAPDLDVLVIPVGGGGLASGIAIAAKAIEPDLELVGVQAELFPAMYNLFHGEQLAAKSDSLAEGIAVKQPGLLTQKIICDLLDDIVLVDEATLERAVSLLIDIEKTVVEGAGAAGVAAIIADIDRFAGRKVGTVLCGGNIDTRLLAGVLTRNLARQGRLSRLLIDLVDQPGHLARVTNCLGDAGANIVEVAHQRVFSDLPAKAALLDVVIETRDRAHLNATVAALEAAGLTVKLETSAGDE